MTNINLEHPMLECQNLQRGFAAFDEGMVLIPCTLFI